LQSSRAVAPLVAGMRRTPLQQRSSQRRALILAAAAELADELGYDDVTTSDIARRAGVAVGSLYRFFEDKRAVFRALSLRHMEQYLATLERSVTGGLDSWQELVDTTIDTYVDMLRTVPGFRGFGDAIDSHLLDARRDNDTVLADGLLDVLTQHFAVSRTADLRLALLSAVTVGDALTSLAFRRSARGDRAVIAEAKRVVRACLAPHLEARPEVVVRQRS
jgi:AcrR family transcriptional regulator